MTFCRECEKFLTGEEAILRMCNKCVKLRRDAEYEEALERIEQADRLAGEDV